jgi:hypothetical protein
MPLELMGTTSIIALMYKREHRKYKRENPKYKREHPKWLGHNHVSIGNVQLGSTHVNIDGCPSMKKIACQKITCSVQQLVRNISPGQNIETLHYSAVNLGDTGDFETRSQ